METKKKIYTIISIFFLLSVFLVMFCIIPLSKEIASESQDLISQRNSRLLLDSQFNEIKAFKQKYEGYKPNLDKIDNLFIDSQNPVAFIEYLEKTALSSGIALQISAPSHSKEGSLTFESFQFSSSGGFSKTLKFIKELEDGPYLVQIQNLTIGANKKSQTVNQTTDIKTDILIKVISKS